ncbi:respiratory nitrate reductase subunit gamma [Neobacillus sp. MM2021_6]|uniref:respiratory nitrate reductase subunit gamma n=1 Tax=Bacillaceae TaxID=186817 RepID=UPI00140B7C00|nr:MULTISPECIES: respiratory nitrate reductase subunit gamma [Bacillaceae]MBO0961732.1 respiratory nitrate reductase subunit gamma [Neobacillus sp. MM2021_6]NHC18323.1 respiratory nitrate reductase subunit gamma [Bacillus sp. MM2020_4]WML39961.1 respiratory nitrate reductase subunit gamma [Neobacillus sp. OS1-2]
MEEIFWWTIFPYICGTILIVATFYRFIFRGKSWYAPSTEIFGKKWLRMGSVIFHYGIIFAFIGHIMGILIPIEFYESIGINEHMYHFGAIAGGGIAGLMVVFGLVVMLIRKFSFPRVRVHTTFADYFTIVLLLIIAALGTYMTLIYSTTVVAYEYRLTIGPWFRSLFTLQPLSDLMIGIPTLFKVHVILSFFLFASIPFTQLVHMFSFPARYPARAPQQYRSRDGYDKG